TSQKLLLPQTVTFSPEDAEILKDITELLGESGFELSGFGKNTFVVHATPPEVPPSLIQSLLESILESYKTGTEDFANNEPSGVARTLARKLSVKHGQRLKEKEMGSLVELLMASTVPDRAPDGKPTMIILPFDELSKKFKHRP
ncbi:MAG: DNA mismatch repair protein MutL, partial [bacterium]